MGARKLLLFFGIIIARIYKLLVYKFSKKVLDVSQLIIHFYWRLAIPGPIKTIDGLIYHPCHTVNQVKPYTVLYTSIK